MTESPKKRLTVNSKCTRDVIIYEAFAFSYLFAHMLKLQYIRVGIRALAITKTLTKPYVSYTATNVGLPKQQKAKSSNKDQEVEVRKVMSEN